MTLTPTGDNVVSASFGTVDVVSNSILEMLMESNTPSGYGILGCALTIGRLMKPSTIQPTKDQITFVENLMDWIGAYQGGEGVGN